MKKLFFAIVSAVTVASSAVFAGNLFSYVPADSQAVVKIDAASILSRPEAVKVLNDPVAMAKQLEFSSKAGCSIKDLKSAVIAVGDAGSEVFLFELSKKIDVAAALKNLGVENTPAKVGKYTVYQGDQRAAISQISGNIVIVGSPEDVKAALEGQQGMSAELTALAKPFAASTEAIAWLVFDAGKSCKGSAVYKFCGQDKADHDFSAQLILKNAEEAAQTAAMVPMYVGMFSGAIFAQNPELGAKVAKGFKVKTAGSNLELKLNISAALADEIASYMAEQGKKSLLSPGKKSEK